MDSTRCDSLVDTAATLPGELPYLSAIAANLSDSAPRLAYAEWLEQIGDSRASFVRDLAFAAQSLSRWTELPEANDYSDSWLNMLGYRLFAGIVENEFFDLRDSVLRIARPAVKIKTAIAAESDIAVGDSKFGGVPDLPPHVEWPRCELGPLAFLGQFALRPLRNTLACAMLPHDGLLSVFAYLGDNGYEPGVIEGVPNDTQIIFTSDYGSRVRRQPPTDISQMGKSRQACRLTLFENYDLTLDAIARALGEFETDDDDDFYDRWDLLTLDFTKHHLFGYSRHFRRETDPSPGPDWTHLLRLGSDHNLLWSWCDGQDLAVYVHTDDVRNQTFSRVYGYAS